MTLNNEKFNSFLYGFKIFIETASGENLNGLSENAFFYEQEGYKEIIKDEALRILNLSTWNESKIGTGYIAECALKAVDKAGNLVHHQQIMHFKNVIKRKTKESERILYNIYCGKNDRKAFDDAITFWGGKYDLLGYLFFIKDTNIYLPIRSSIFDKRFEFLGISLKTSRNCSSENYFEFISIIEELRVLMERYYGFAVTLLEAHSVIWQLDLANQFVAQFEEKTADVVLTHEINRLNIDTEVKRFEYLVKPKEKTEAIYTNGHKTYPRNRHTALNALNHAMHCCEIDLNHESFIRRNSEYKYMEPHHLIPMSYSDNFNVSLDVEENIVSLCSNCHNEIHYGKNAKKLVEKLFEQRKDLLKKVGIEITLETLLSMYE